MGMDKIKITILEDGTIKSQTDEISGPNHANAENFMKAMSRMTDNKMTRTKRKPDHFHSHDHGQTHSH